MKISFRNITNALRNSAAFVTCLALVQTGAGFQLDTESNRSPIDFSAQLQSAEGGHWEKASRGIQLLFSGDYPSALAETQQHPDSYPAWFSAYLTGLKDVASPLVSQTSEHFELWTPPDQKFLGLYALPALERASDYFAKQFSHRPKQKIRVEIYPTKEAFSSASTLSVATLESSGAIGICKFHRLMILTPQALPIGYRWMDALTHEYTHLMINELSEAHAELWLHEGIARYFETAPRSQPPLFLTPLQKTDLKKAAVDKKLISFQRMSPSMVYLKDQTEVSLAFSQVAYAVSQLVKKKGESGLAQFLVSLRQQPFASAFAAAYGVGPEEFQNHYQELIVSEPWVATRGALSDDVRFTPLGDEEAVGAEAQMQMRFGDRMRQKGLYEAALTEYERALEQEPDNAVLLLKAARACLAMNQPKEAKSFLERAVEKNPNYVTPYVELSKLVDKSASEILLKEALALNPFDPAIHEALGTNAEKSIAASLKDKNP